MLAEYGLGRAHHRVLHFVNRHPGLRVADLLDILKITKQSLARVLKQLVDEGWIAQMAGETDRRQRLLHATDKGAALSSRLDAMQARRVAQALEAAGGNRDAGRPLPVCHDHQGGARTGRDAAAWACRGCRLAAQVADPTPAARRTHGTAARQRCPHSGRRRRPAHPRSAGPLSVRERVSRIDRHRRRHRALVHARAVVRRRHPRCHDAGRDRSRTCPRSQVDLQHTDLHADRPRRARAAHRGPGDRRRRLRRQAVRAPRAAAAPAEHPQARTRAVRARATRSAWATSPSMSAAASSSATRKASS